MASSNSTEALSMSTALPEKARRFAFICPWGNGPAQGNRKSTPSSPCAAAPECILIAEDNDDLRDAAQEILQSLGYRVISAKDGAEALRIFEAEKDAIDLVFLDVVLPKAKRP
jgi:PleD family two-component response regulator